MAKRTLKILQQIMTDFYSAFDHFGKLKGWPPIISLLFLCSNEYYAPTLRLVIKNNKHWNTILLEPIILQKNSVKNWILNLELFQCT